MADSLELIISALAGRYAVERQLGEGGMATVYLARDERHRRMVAVKVLRPELTRSMGVERFSREIDIAARLNHPHILPLLDSGTIDLGPDRPSAAYYVMPYVPGESLRHRLERDGRLEVPEALRIAREVADALDYAHRQGVVHRDIKPENILISDQHAVVADFGIARALDEAGAGGSGITSVGQLLGTPLYMSPEQVVGEAALDGRSDIYALACTLYEMLAGQPAWTGGSITTLMARRLAQPAPRIRTLFPAIPHPVDNALARALSIDPAERYQTAAEFAAALTDGAARGTGVRRTGAFALAGAAATLAVVLLVSKFAQPGRADAITSLAIAPQNMDSAIQYLSDGIQEGVADLLRHLPRLRVMAPSVVEQVRRREPAIDNAALGDRLGVDAVLTWHLDRAGDSLRVRAELFRVPGADLLWSARLTRPLSELAMIQGSVARLIADSLRLQLGESDRTRLTRMPTSNATAYDLFARGRRFQMRAIPLGATGARESLDSVRELGRRAIEMDSSFGAANALLGMYYFHSALRGFTTPFKAYIDSGLDFSRRAIALDSSLGDAWIALMSNAIYLNDDWEDAREIARHAARSASRFDPVVQNYLGIYTAEVEGRLDSGIQLVRRSIESDPSTVNLNTLGDLYLRTRRNDSAVVVLRRAIAFDPAVPGPHRRLLLALERSGRFDEAILERRSIGDSSAAQFADALRRDGPAGYRRVLESDTRRRIAVLTAAAARPFEIPRDTIPPTREFQIATLYAQLGEWTPAMDWIMRERQHRPGRFRIYAMNPEFAGLRADARFDSLLRVDRIRPVR